MCSQWRCMAFNLTTKLEGKWFSNIQNTLHMSCIYYAVKFMKLVCNDMFERGNGSKQLWYSTMKRIWGEHVNNDEDSMNFAINQSRPNIPSVPSPHGEKMNTKKEISPSRENGRKNRNTSKISPWNSAIFDQLVCEKRKMFCSVEWVKKIYLAIKSKRHTAGTKY